MVTEVTDAENKYFTQESPDEAPWAKAELTDRRVRTLTSLQKRTLGLFMARRG
jgi:hypothetical protein